MTSLFGLERQIAGPDIVLLLMSRPSFTRACWSTLWPMVLVTLGAFERPSGLLAGAGAVGERIEGDGPKLQISMSQGPPSAAGRAMRSWICKQENELARLRQTWTAVAVAIHRGEVGEWTSRCHRLRGELKAVERSLERPPDRLSWFYLARGLKSMRVATRSCSRTSLFALSHGLSQARELFRRFDDRLRWLDAQRCEGRSELESDRRE